MNIKFLEDGSSAVGAGRICFVTFNMQKLFEKSKFNEIIIWYPLLIEEIIEFIRKARLFLHKF